MHLTALMAALILAQEHIPKFREEVIETQSGGPGYNSCIADINGDGKPDLVLVTENKDQVLWYENPTWKRRVITAGLPRLPEPITPFDVDGDGKTEIVVGGDWRMADTLTSGSVWLLKRPDRLESIAPQRHAEHRKHFDVCRLALMLPRARLRKPFHL